MNGIQPGQKAPSNPNSGLTFVLGLLAAFWLTGLIYNSTIEPVTDYAVEQYGDWTESLVWLVWFPLCGGGIFFVTRIATHFLIEHVKFQFQLWRARRRF